MEDRFALLIDADNVSAKYIKPILDELSKYGNVTYKRIYGDWTKTNNASWKEELLQNSITPIQQFSYTHGKNATDSAMIIDAMDMLYTSELEGFCLVSSDSDFTKLASRLRESGKTVIGMGEGKTPSPFRKACDIFTELELLLEDNTMGKEERNIHSHASGKWQKKDNHDSMVSKEKIEEAVVKIITENQNNDRETGLGEVGSRLVKLYPDFDVRRYGYSLLSKFLESLPKLMLMQEGTKVTVTIYEDKSRKEMLEEYINLLAKKKQDPQSFETKLDLANNAQRMMEKVEDVQIIDSLVVDKDDFLSAYILSEESGTLDSYKDFFQTNEPVSSTVYKNQKGDKIYYAHSTDGDRYCLFTQSMLMDEWGDEKQLPMNINSNDDDNYPFVLSDGATIYYSSKGNGSIGGYDLFVTRYNINSDTYLAPEQLGMPFNSPYNDYMMVFDEVKGLGWFVSDRFQPEGKACVYLFIPNPEHKRVESEDIEVKRARAAITAIRDSWKESSDYADLIRLSHTEIPYGEKKIEKDFEFIIGNNIVYYKLDDINSPEAKGYYEKVVALNKQIKELNEKLDGLRVSYAEGNKARKEQLKPTILQAEEQLNALLEQPGELEKKARNAEINYLKNKR